MASAGTRFPQRSGGSTSGSIPFGWVGILVSAPPSTDLVTYAWHERGFALSSMRSPEVTRLYVQCDHDDDMAAWPERRIWDELHTRLPFRAGRSAKVPILESGITGMRSFVTEPMQHQRLFLAGDAAHIVPPTGAKGLNLALADVRVLARRSSPGTAPGARRDSMRIPATCLKRVWRAQEFSSWMTALLHRFPDDHGGFEPRLQRARLANVVTSRAAATALAENYVG